MAIRSSVVMAFLILFLNSVSYAQQLVYPVGDPNIRPGLIGTDFVVSAQGDFGDRNCFRGAGTNQTFEPIFNRCFQNNDPTQPLRRGFTLRKHLGVDLAVPALVGTTAGQEVRPVADGVIVAVVNTPQWGNVVIIQHSFREARERVKLENDFTAGDKATDIVAFVTFFSQYAHL